MRVPRQVGLRSHAVHQAASFARVLGDVSEASFGLRQAGGWEV